MFLTPIKFTFPYKYAHILFCFLYKNEIIQCLMIFNLLFSLNVPWASFHIMTYIYFNHISASILFLSMVISNFNNQCSLMSTYVFSYYKYTLNIYRCCQINISNLCQLTLTLAVQERVCHPILFLTPSKNGSR